MNTLAKGPMREAKDYATGKLASMWTGAMLIAQFLGFLEHNKMIRYNVETQGDMNPDKIDQKLLDELYG